MAVWLAHNCVLETEMVVLMLLTFQTRVMDLSVQAQAQARRKVERDPLESETDQ